MEKNTKVSERDERLKKLKELQNLGLDPYPSKAKITHDIGQTLADFKALEKNQKDIFIAGRLRVIRAHGNLTFARLDDGSGQMQIVLSKKEVGQDNYKNFTKLIDAGDFIEARGRCFVTQKGEESLLVKNWKLLAKALRPLPSFATSGPMRVVCRRLPPSSIST